MKRQQITPKGCLLGVVFASGTVASANYQLKVTAIGLGDNCILVINPNQRDTGSDGYGNLCDADFNGDVRVNTLDFGRFKQMFGKPVGPSGIAT